MINKFIKAVLATALFVLVLLTVYAVHMTMFRVNVVFYAAIADALIAAAICCALVFFVGYFRILSGFEKSQLIVIWLLSGYAFAISVPTVIDRSLSFYILEKIQQRGGGIRQDAFERVFTQEYVKEHRLVDVRITEQLESGTIEIKNGCVLLTAKGELIAAFGRYYRTHWLPKQRLLMGVYSADLTDPFRTTTASQQYECSRD
jgi:hypothetical protein